MPSAQELRGWSRLVAGVTDEVVVTTIHQMHRVISDGAFRWIGPVGRPVWTVADHVTERTYATIQASVRGLGEVGARLADHVGSAEAIPTPAAAKARAIAQGVVGEGLRSHAPELETDLGLWQGGIEVAVDGPGLRAAYPAASGRVVVFVHGLVDTEAVWHARTEARVALPDVAAELGATPVLVRFGTGHPIRRSGADLAELLEELVAAWPVAVTELILVGHSMGGLVIRAAGTAARQRNDAWPAAVTDVLYLGTPHLGSWLEKVANVGSWVLRRASSRTAPLGTLLDGRSPGIKDLRFGTVTGGADPRAIDELLSGRVPDEPWLDGVRHHLVVGRLRAAEHHPLNVLFGDSLVRGGSAAGRGRRRRIPDGGEVRIVPVVSRHSDLVAAGEVASLLREVLAIER